MLLFYQVVQLYDEERGGCNYESKSIYSCSDYDSSGISMCFFVRK